MVMSTVSICVLFPDLLGTYGDGGNATVLTKRLQWRGRVPSDLILRWVKRCPTPVTSI